MQQGEGTDPLRAALEDIAALRVIDGIDGRPCPGWAINKAKSIAREALAVAPEPEWEYRACSDARCTLPLTDEIQVRKLASFNFGHNLFEVTRRRKAIPPGEWEALPDD